MGILFRNSVAQLEKVNRMDKEYNKVINSYNGIRCKVYGSVNDAKTIKVRITCIAKYFNKIITMYFQYYTV